MSKFHNLLMPLLASHRAQLTMQNKRYDADYKSAYDALESYVTGLERKADASDNATIPFDLERAKSGAEFEVKFGNAWHAAKFVGESSLGPVVEFEYDIVTYITARCISELRMKPVELRTAYVNMYHTGFGAVCSTADEARKIAEAGAIHVAWSVKIPVV